MSKGSLKCCGSPLFLKSKYGSGYNLVLTKKRNTDQASANAADYGQGDSYSDKILQLVRSVIPSAKLHSDISSEISFMLPISEAGLFSELFEKLEKLKDSLNILNIGISITTLEDVFLK
jgi:ATP-binding cassette subfamily A (ABC1) protein 3